MIMADLFEASEINAVRSATKVKAIKSSEDASTYSAKDIEVLEGLDADERVVKEGLARLADGMTVRPLTK